MMKKGVCLFVCLLTFMGCQSPIEPSQGLSPQSPPALERVRVLYVIDGDTIVVSRHGKREKVRMLLIDAPEDTSIKEPYGWAATKRVRQILAGKMVDLEFDIEQYDRYDRLLAYVYLDGQSIQQQLLLEGLAKVKVYPPNQKYEALFRHWESTARQHHLGIWSQ